MWYDFAIDSLRHGQTYRRAEIISVLKKERDGLSENSYVWAVGNLVKNGLLNHDGRNRYSLAGGKKKTSYIPLYSEAARDIRDQVEMKYPLIGFTVFESVLLNEFLNHQIARNTIFIQAERDIGTFVFEFLRESTNRTVMYRPSQKEYSRYWQPDSVVVLDWTSEAPLDGRFPHDITIEKLLVDIFCDKTIRKTYSESEYASVVETAYDRYNIDTVRLLRYARRRNKEKEIKDFIPERQRIKENAIKR